VGLFRLRSFRHWNASVLGLRQQKFKHHVALLKLSKPMQDICLVWR
jgi:hypothetical protein